MEPACPTILLPGTPGYPSALTDEGPPLYVSGALPSLPGVAIVGTREPSPEALEFTRHLAADLVAAGYAVWSGGARGIDAAAHDGALCAGGITVVCAPGPTEQPYPPEHRGLFERARRAGAVVSLAPPGARLTTASFHQRNHLLAALTEATVVVEAGLESGARSTARSARRLGKPLCAVPHSPWNERGVGCVAELFAGAVLVVSADDVVAAIAGPSAGAAPRKPRRRSQSEKLPFGRVQAAEPTLAMRSVTPERAPELVGASPEETALLRQLTGQSRHVDELATAVGASVAQVTGLLVALAIEGRVAERQPGEWALSAREA